MATSKREIVATFAHLMELTGGDYNQDDPFSGMVRNDQDRWDFVVGRFYLDNAPIYGGYCIERISNEHGGTSSITMHGLSAGRMGPGEFCRAMRFAIDLLEALKG